MQDEERSDILTTTADRVVEGELVDEGMAETIGRMRSRGMAKKAIARELGLDIKTVRKWIGTEWKAQTRQRQPPAPEQYDEWIRRRFPEVGCSARVLHRELQEKGYTDRTSRCSAMRGRFALQRGPRRQRRATRPHQVDWGMFSAPPELDASDDRWRRRPVPFRDSAGLGRLSVA